MNCYYEKHYSSTSKRLRLVLYDKRTETHLYVLRNNVASTMSSFIEILGSDFTIFRAEKSLHTDLGQRKSSDCMICISNDFEVKWYKSFQWQFARTAVVFFYLFNNQQADGNAV